jgi:rhomboid protease GlpG
MRELTALSTEASARRLAAALQVASIPATVDFESDQWVVWIENDDDRERADEIVAAFQADPDADEFSKALLQAEQKQKSAAKVHAAAQRRQMDLKKRWSGSWWHCYPATQIMTVLCVVVVLFTTDWGAHNSGFMGLPMTCDRDDSALLDALYFQAPVIGRDPSGAIGKGWEPIGLAELIKRGQVWRFVTPAFIHFGVVHILFNLMWLRLLGMAVEFIRGTRRFLVLCVVIAVVSHTAQFLWSGPAFGGMSGVVYGLIGYVWMKGRTQPQLGLGLTPNQIVYAVLWLFLCMGGAFGAVANAAHLGGFVVGILIGGRQAIWKRISDRPRDGRHD